MKNIRQDEQSRPRFDPNPSRIQVCRITDMPSRSYAVHSPSVLFLAEKTSNLRARFPKLSASLKRELFPCH
jgi:hypothetical protein